ncbi:MAG: trypsin-like peptidase domain-containing protein [Patescibacteria group bacterium]
MNKFVAGVALGVLVVGAVVTGAIGQKMWGEISTKREVLSTKLLNEESVVIDVAEKVSPSVVTIGIKTTRLFRQSIFGRVSAEEVEQDIGSGFVISDDGLIATNKHVVGDTEATYKVITSDDKTYDVQRIYRDSLNDLAILKIDTKDLKAVDLGDSSKLKVGQFVVAIGTALGEFRHTVTTGVVSGLGRGITAGSPFEGSERLDDVIQTDAAINPGNSGGPLLNSAGQVIGVNTAVSAGAENIGFAIPINVIKEAIDNFNKTGQFSRPYLGIQYRLISKQTALLNDVPQGAYIQALVPESPAEKAGIEEGDILTLLDGKKLEEDKSVASIISSHKVGDTIEVELWRDGETQKLKTRLEEAE